eukprot:5828318-Pyramimonas_sp.AAC.2
MQTATDAPRSAHVAPRNCKPTHHPASFLSLLNMCEKNRYHMYLNLRGASNNNTLPASSQGPLGTDLDLVSFTPLVTPG